MHTKSRIFPSHLLIQVFSGFCREKSYLTRKIAKFRKSQRPQNWKTLARLKFPQLQLQTTAQICLQYQHIYVAHDKEMAYKYRQPNFSLGNKMISFQEKNNSKMYAQLKSHRIFNRKKRTFQHNRQYQKTISSLYHTEEIVIWLFT